MVKTREDLIKQSLENRKTVEKTLATAKRGMTLTDVAEATKLPVSTVKRHLEKLISIGRVHVDSYRGFSVYVWNGEKVYQDKIFLSENHILYIDAMVNPWGKPFIRVKESKRIPGSNKWDDVGAILIDEKRIIDFIGKLSTIKQKLGKYGESKLEPNED